jgi:hypothetical protein
MRSAAIFHPAALSAIREFPKGARREIGEAVLKIQWGASIGMPLSRPMPSVARGVHERRRVRSHWHDGG